MNRRTLSILLAYCLVNWFCIHVLLVSAEEDDAERVPPTTTTIVTSTQEQEDSIEIPKNDGDSPSEANDTYYPEDEYRLQDGQPDSPAEDRIPPRRSSDDEEDDDDVGIGDETPENSEKGKEGHMPITLEADVRSAVTPEMDDERHEDDHTIAGQHHEDSIVFDTDTDTNTDADDTRVMLDNNKEEEQADLWKGEAEEGDNPVETYTRGNIDEREDESILNADEENDEHDGTRDSIGEIEDDGGEDILEPVRSRSGTSNDDNIVEVNDGEGEGEMKSATDDDTIDTIDETTSSMDEQATNTEDVRKNSEQGGDFSLAEEQVAEDLEGHTETSTDTDYDYSDDAMPTTDANMGETNEVGKVEPEGDISRVESTTAEVPKAGLEDFEDSTDSTTTTEIPLPVEELSASKIEDEDDILDLDEENDVTATGDIRMDDKILDTPSVEHEEESTQPASPNGSIEENSDEASNAQSSSDGSHGRSCRGIWGTPKVGARPPDMELLYHVFESRIQKQLGIGPIPESQLRENLFPLGIGFDEASITDDERTPDETAGNPAAQAKDVNSDFVEGLDDIDKFFEGVDPPDELDVGASGSSMQDMLMKKGKEILIKRFWLGFKIVHNGFVAAKGKVSARLSALKENDVDIKAIAKTAWSRTTKTYESLVEFVDGVLDFGSSDEEAEDFESFKKMAMEDLQRDNFISTER
ncbi:unnamed protein product [Cylindrotheca closterium]|uniref:Uncharacterized protein n=1 Tax=Cylindrotheca closterium TaxID=2856 RepID=A0AAD2CKQ5_9STRA|nr:unnamed protein product [Cylindrotheca closterium]